MAATLQGGSPEASGQDRRFMAAAIRFSRRHLGLTGTNPSVATLIVRDGVIVGRGLTALGGRPHAEAQALAEAGDLARGATAYVTLEPCAHHGRTPPCAAALIAAGIVRVVGAAGDPDPRVAGRGYAMLRHTGVTVTEGVLAEEAANLMAGYLMRSVAKRPEVTVKIAVSSDGMIGRAGEGQVPITGAAARAQVHAMRAETDAILIGIGTALADDPQLTCRLPGMESRSPQRIVLDRRARLPLGSRLVRTAAAVPLTVACRADADEAARTALAEAGATLLSTVDFEGRVALPEFLEDLGALGVSTVMVEGGATTVRHFLEDDMVDRIALFTGSLAIGEGGIAAPFTRHDIPAGFRLARTSRYGEDDFAEYCRVR